MLELLSDFGAFVLAFLGHWQSYMTGGIVLAIVAVYERLTTKTVSRRTVGFGLVAFTVAAFFTAWREQHEAAKAEHAEVTRLTSQLNAMSTPRLTAAIDFTSHARGGPRNKDLIVGVFATISNTGAASIAKEFRVIFLAADGKATNGEMVVLPRDKLTMGDSRGKNIELSSSNFLPRKAIANPIPTGGAVTGFILVLVRNVTHEDFTREGAHVILEFNDVNGTRHEAQSHAGSRDEVIVMPADLQPRRR